MLHGTLRVPDLRVPPGPLRGLRGPAGAPGRRSLAVPAAVLAALSCAGCVDTAWWQGGESGISFRWTVNGGDPATACAVAGGSEVRMWIAQGLPTCTLESESCGVRDAGWTWDCVAGTASTGSRFAAVELYVGWALVDAAGVVRAWTPWQSASLAPGENFLGTQDFVP
ncbi:MAG: hypothetical protein HY907_20170 [Deltaproteobacteria bacterium]|nr:hypothetical protein [Deltaproteobacteria bacterium]